MGTQFQVHCDINSISIRRPYELETSKVTSAKGEKVTPSSHRYEQLGRWWNNRGLLLFAFVVTAVVFGLHLFENVRYSSDSRLLDMDEQIIFSGISQILHPSNFSSWLHALSDGEDLRYGRAYWNVPAVFSALPTYLAGDQGTILTTRLVSQISLFLSYLNIALVLRPLGPKRVAGCLLTLVLLPSTAYLATMPKAEALMILALSIVLRRAVHLAKLDSRSFVFLGFAWGLKISLLPIVVTLLVLGFVTSIKKHGDIRHALFQAMNAILAILIGWILCTPMTANFLWPGMLSIGISWLLTRKLNTQHGNRTLLLISTLLTFVVVSAVFTVSSPRSSESLNRWLQWTVFNTSHGQDSSNVTYLTWLKFIVTEYLNLQLVSLIVVVGSLVAVSFALTVGWIGKSKMSNIMLLTLIAGLTLILPVVLEVKRHWGYYLHIGLALVVVGLFGSFEFKRGPSVKTSQLISECRTVFFVSMAIFLSNLGFNYLQASASRLDSRDTQMESLLSSDSEIRSAILADSGLRTEPASVALDPLFLQLPTDNRYETSNFWGPFTDWNAEFDFVVLDEVHLPAELRENRDSRSDSGDPQTASHAANNVNIMMHVGVNRECEATPCYRIIQRLSSGGVVLQRMD